MVRVNANHHHVLQLQIKRAQSSKGSPLSMFFLPIPSLLPHGYLQCPQLPSELAVQLEGNLGGHTHHALWVPNGPGLDALGGD